MNVSDWLRRSPRPPQGEQIGLVAALAQAVEEGHQAGVQYAGWTPGKIKIMSDGRVDLAALDAEGKPGEDLAYTAPEASDGAGHTTRADVYSAGVVLYEILAGSHPFGGLSVKQPRGAPKPLHDVRPELPQDLTDAITACLERDPDWRPPDLSYVLQVARQFSGAPEAAVASLQTPTIRVKAGKTSAVPAAPAVTISRPPTGTQRSPSFSGRPVSAPPNRLPLLVAAVLVVASAGVAFWTLRKPSADSGGTSAGGSATAAPTTATQAPGANAAASPAAGSTPAPARSTPDTAARPQAGAATAAATEPPAETAPPTAPPVTPSPVRTVSVASASTPTAPPATSAPVAATAAPAVPETPASLSAVSPFKLRRGERGLLDVRGQGLRADHRLAFTKAKGRSEPTDVQSVSQKLVDPTLLKAMVAVTTSAPTGAYTVSVVDSAGRVSNTLNFEVLP